MMSRQFCRRVHERSPRFMGTLVATEEFALTPPVRAHVRQAAVITESTVKNGIKIVSRDTGAPMTTLRFAVRGGSRAESLSEKGAAHMLSVTAFGGTARVSGLRLCRELETVGAQISSSSDREKVVYSVTVPSDKAEDAIARLGEAIVCPPSATYVIDDLKAKGQIDYDHHKSSPLSQLKEMLHEAAYGEDSPLGGSVYAYNLNKLNTADIQAFRLRLYNGNNLTVSSTGGVSHDMLKQMVECYFVQMPQADPENIVEELPSPYQGGDMKVRTDLDGMTYLAIGFPIPSGLAAKPYHVLHEVISTKISKMDINKTALVPFYYTYTSGGVFGFYANGAASEATALLQAAVAELKAAASGSADIEPAKTKVSLQGRLSLEGEAAAESLLMASLCNVSATEITDVSGVTVQDVKAAAMASLKAVPSYAVLGATAGTPSFTAICKLVSI